MIIAGIQCLSFLHHLKKSGFPIEAFGNDEKRFAVALSNDEGV
jgi:predicted HTH domain antitoxin